MSGDYFYVVSKAGLYWSGERWVRERALAQKFGGSADPLGECLALADALRQRFGFACNVVYTAPQLPDSAGAKRPLLCRGRGSRHRVGGSAQEGVRLWVDLG